MFFFDGPSKKATPVVSHLSPRLMSPGGWTWGPGDDRDIGAVTCFNCQILGGKTLLFFDAGRYIGWENSTNSVMILNVGTICEEIVKLTPLRIMRWE